MQVADDKPHEVVREGVALHSGTQARVTLRRAPGPCTFRRAGREIPVVEARVAGTFRATTLDLVGECVSTVEHLLAACGGLGLHDGISIEVVGSELPLLDGAARAWCDALDKLGVRATAPTLEVARDAEVHVGESRYVFRRAPGVRVAVTIDFGDARLAKAAEWNGDPVDFIERIAPARTFAFQHELEALAALGLGSHVTPSSVVVIGEEAVLSAGAAFSADEPARHKLLDLVGDLFLWGGPPEGAVSAHRPGHAATSAAMREARESGILRRRGVLSSARDA
jgi:UDP-3-O-[3-hydroxymyristoyl] N-acetylglucosamine deacetylase